MNAAELEATVESDSRRLDAIVAAVSELTSMLALQVEENADSIAADRELRAELDLLSSRVKLLELRDRRRHARGDRRLIEDIERAVDPIEDAHALHLSELTARRYVVVGTEADPPILLGDFARAENGTVLYRGLDGRAERTTAGVVAIVTPIEAESIIAGRRPA